MDQGLLEEAGVPESSIINHRSSMNADGLRIDHHKLLFHVDRVSDWLKSERIYPLYMEVSPAGSCNHRCVFCGLDFMGYQPRFLDADLLKTRLTEMGSLGLKSIMFAGEGEPFLHRRMVEIILHAKEQSGIDVAVTTNGVLMRSDVQFFRPAKEIDPVYASTLKEVAKKGVEVIVAGTTITPRGIIIDREIPFEI